MFFFFKRLQTISFTMPYITANIGTPINIPAIPNIPPKNIIANNTQNVFNPVALPMHFGPIICPSICCSTIINIKKYIDFIDDSLRTIMKLGIAPMNGPAKGIIFVIATMTDIRTVYGILSILNDMKHIKPIIMLSIVFPIKKSLNTLFA